PIRGIIPRAYRSRADHSRAYRSCA
ncbi:unnamed protein product, partial [Rotaria sordida]